MKIYLTARWGRREEMKAVREKLVAAGHVCTARWLDEPEETPYAVAAQMDLDDIDFADALIVFTETTDVGYLSGGRHVELGYALAKDKTIVLVGPRENVFCWLPQVSRLTNADDAIVACEFVEDADNRATCQTCDGTGTVLVKGVCLRAGHFSPGHPEIAETSSEECPTCRRTDPKKDAP